MTGRTEPDLWDVYRNIPSEMAAIDFTPAERSYLDDYYRDAGLLRPGRLAFFRHHFSSTFARSAEFLLHGRERPVILDLGCGGGTQTLFLALRGARVIALDRDSVALSVLDKRRHYWEREAGVPLDVIPVQGNAFDLTLSEYPPLDGIHSMFAFNMMRPGDRLIRHLTARWVPGQRIAILDGNRVSWLGILRSIIRPARLRSLSPLELRDLLEDIGFTVAGHAGGISLPPIAWRVGPKKAVETLDALLCAGWLWPVSHQILAERAAQ